MNFVKRFLLLALSLAGSAQAQGNKRPVVLISGDGNISIESVGVAGGAAGNSSIVAAGAAHGSVNKHDQTMEVAQNLLKFCPSLEVTLDRQSTPDYFIALNREGHPTVFGELGSSQIMALNARKSVLFVSKDATVKNAVKNACNAIAADWQANGRITQSFAPRGGTAALPGESSRVESATVTSEGPTVMDAALVMRTTERANKYCKPETIASILTDMTAYLSSKGLSLGTVANSKTIIEVIVDRPFSKWIEITVQAHNQSGNLLWNDKESDASWGHLGEQALLNTLDKIHRGVDSHLADSVVKK